MDIKRIISGKTDNTFVQFFRYIFVGGGATVVQYFIEIFLVEAFSVNENISNLFGFIGGLVTNYIISTCWVFNASKVKNKAAEFSAFALIGVVGLGINQLLIWTFSSPLAQKEVLGSLIPTDKYYIVGQVIATAITFAWNFFARKILLYSDKGKEPQENCEDRDLEKLTIHGGK